MCLTVHQARLWQDGQLLAKPQTSAFANSSGSIGAYIYSACSGARMLINVGLSFVSITQAANNMASQSHIV